MSRLFHFLSVLFSFSLIFCSLPKKVHEPYTAKALPQIQKKYAEDFTMLQKKADSFAVSVEVFSAQHRVSLQKLKDEYSVLRKHFKKIEYLVAYLDDEAFNKALNGAPLLKVEPKTADFMILAPKGFQVLDELMADPTENKNEIHKIATQLSKDIQKIKKYIGTYAFSDRQYFEASRQALIRLTTLGITGFDTPGTLAGIKDAVTVVKTLQETARYYNKELRNVGREELGTNLQKTFVSGMNQLTKNTNFESFDRLSFIKEKINPLYKQYLEIHSALGYEKREEVTPYASSLTYKAENLFNKNFLNRFFYVSLKDDEHFELKAALGKLLFYDPVLSSDNKMSCATCHHPDKAFTDGNMLSLGSDGKPLMRNTMTLAYSGLAIGYFHDLRVKRLEDQFEHVIVHENEYNTSYEKIAKKLKNSNTYSDLFTEAFPEYKKVAAHTINYALAAYVLKLNAFDSPIDLYMRGEIADISENIKRGFNLFTGKAACATCHFLPTFNGTVPPLYKESESEVLGVSESLEDKTIMDDDLGRFANGRETAKADHLKNSFKTPTLRNIARTAPYMHNGIYGTLQEVMDFYNKGGGAGHGMEVPHQTLAPDPLKLSDQEIEDMIAFMNALSDTTVFEAPKTLPNDFQDIK